MKLRCLDLDLITCGEQHLPALFSYVHSMIISRIGNSRQEYS